ncbi:MAG: hypothetical protein BWY52_01199 [Chloroflexi bacterium ADurb.Bin325]|nr:MAG: hypothetical protein BWY52_01199 [Chloroflexi bacterium ADurb.Bin325]
MARQAVREQPHIARALAVGLRADVGKLVAVAQDAGEVAERGHRLAARLPARHVGAVDEQRRLGVRQRGRCACQRGREGPPGRGLRLAHGAPALPARGRLALGLRGLQRICQVVQQAGLLAGVDRQVCAALRARILHVARQLDPPRVDDDQLLALAQHGALDVEIQHRRVLAGVDAHQHHDVALGDVRDRGQAGRVGAHARAVGIVHVVGADQHAHELLEQIGRLVADVRGRDAADALRPLLLSDAPQPVHDAAQRLVPGRGPQFAVLADQRRAQPLRVVDVLIEETALVADPLVVDGQVLPRHDAAHLVHPLIEPEVAADRAEGADARRLLDLPGAVVEPRHAVGQRADRTEVDDAARGLGVHRLVGEDVDDRLVSALEEPELRLVLPLLQITDAAPAQDAALLIQHDQVADGVVLLLAALRLHELADARPVIVGLILQRAFAALVADRAVERVVEEQEAEDGLAHRAHLLGVRLDDHALVHAHGTGGVEAAAARAGELDQAHPAGAEGVQLRVRAEDRDVDARRPRRVDDQRSRGNLDFHIINGHVDRVSHAKTSIVAPNTA